ncbi:MAG: twin-arginine translocation signal domain-containing protein [Rhodocyclaceae bacterium]|nr:twin-arginine translocation signal domain-containing protein [Rhodocyclaceae bacterium]MCB1962019.1 twin-arginine translocation signal domain-containing protein [Rhodocyclaceae bacterium]
MHEPSPRHELHDIADLDPDGLPSRRSLLKACGVALAIAAVLLIVAILPAEYGVDPTGLGARMGLTALHVVDAVDAVDADTPQPVVPGAMSEPRRPSATPYRADTLSVVLQPRQGAEIKAVMAQGQGFVFEWVAEGGPVYVDMHGEPPNAGKDVFTSFWIGDAQERDSGTFSAPFSGAHGWYWENRGEAVVTIRLKASGFYETLYMP